MPTTQGWVEAMTSVTAAYRCEPQTAQFPLVVVPDL
jgi:hypothetical protein